MSQTCDMNYVVGLFSNIWKHTERALLSFLPVKELSYRSRIVVSTG